MSKTVEEMQFNAQTNKVLKMMINSVYTNKDVFLRELISNAADAIEKRRYLALKNDSTSPENGEYFIKIDIDPKHKTISIMDNGIGMTRQEMIDNLGTIAKSGTEEFGHEIEKDDKKEDNYMIGQFGVGFYSAFMVADKVIVSSKKVGADGGYTWTSDGENGFSIEQCYDVIKEGTIITLNIKESESAYLDKFKLKFIAETYSNSTNIPITIHCENEVEKVKGANAIWHLDKNSISEDVYNDFYKSISHLPDKPMLTIHYNPEGIVEFKSLLFVPSMRPFDLFHPDRQTRVKLYSKKIFITENYVNIIPRYLRFIYGVVESSDIQLNISRETLQENTAIEKISDLIVKRIFNDLKKLGNEDPDKYLLFWNNFGVVLKEGLCEPTQYRQKILENALFYTTKSCDKPISLQQYVSQMKTSQDEIYYCLSDNIDNAMSNPQIEAFVKNDVEVILMVDSVDSFWTNVVTEYDKKPFKSISRIDTKLNDELLNKDDKEKEIDADVNKDEIVRLFTKALSGKVKEVTISTKLLESPACISVPENGMDINMERFLIEQQQIKQGILKILEVNPTHPLIKLTVDKLKNEITEEDGKDFAVTIFEMACIAQGEIVKNSALFIKRLNRILTSITL